MRKFSGTVSSVVVLIIETVHVPPGGMLRAGAFFGGISGILTV